MENPLDHHNLNPQIQSGSANSAHSISRDLGILSENGILSLLLQGPTLAGRPQEDIHILISGENVPATKSLLESAGYFPMGQPPKKAKHPKIKFVKTGVAGACNLTVHWKISQSPFFAHLFSFQELWAASIEKQLDGMSHRTLCDQHALILNCIHRVLRNNENRAIWLYDIHMLANNRSSEWMHDFSKLAANKQVLAICCYGLALAQECFGTRLSTSAEGLRHRAERARERSKIYLRLQRRPLDRLLCDFIAAPSMGDRLRLLREHLFAAS